jgi:LPS sulfotransferase NodH
MNRRVPAGGYVLCASPRSGSTLLCDMLARTGVAGSPGSFFRDASVATYRRRWGVAPEGVKEWGRDYVEAVRDRGTGATGCFGMRIMWSDMPAFLNRLRRLYPSPSDDVERLRATFGIERFVHLSRADRIRQAVSLVLARQSGLWHQNADGSDRERSAPSRTPRYDFDEIASVLRVLDDEAVGWQRWFESTSVVPLTVGYEALSVDPKGELQRVLRHLEAVCTDLPEPGTAKLASAVNDIWSTRYAAEQSARRSGMSIRRPVSTWTPPGGREREADPSG